MGRNKEYRKEGNIEIENAQSGTFFLPKNAYELTHLSGRWGYEYQMNVTKLTQGLKTIQTKTCVRTVPSLCNQTRRRTGGDFAAEVWFGSLQYSGNWRMDFEKYAPGEVQGYRRYKFLDQLLVLQPGKSFTNPKMMIGYTNRGWKVFRRTWLRLPVRKFCILLIAIRFVRFYITAGMLPPLM